MSAMHSVLRPGRYPAPRIPSHRMPETPGDAASDARGAPEPGPGRGERSRPAARMAPPKKPGTSAIEPGRRGGGEADRRGQQDRGQSPPARGARSSPVARPRPGARAVTPGRDRAASTPRSQARRRRRWRRPSRAAPARGEGSARACPPRRPTTCGARPSARPPRRARPRRRGPRRPGTGSRPRTGRAGGGGRARSRPRASGPAPARAARGRGGRTARRAAARTTTRKKLKYVKYAPKSVAPCADASARSRTGSTREAEGERIQPAAQRVGVGGHRRGAIARPPRGWT